MSRRDQTSRMEREIDQNLKRAYEDVANQELPTRFTDLLDQLRSQDATTKGKDNTDER
ncbi:NepR family anti-sigma factor [uncultured Tateyamaria sp.]|uniref:NepR family anti-sigma factor n=1 Tax=uncultured Tateyamaria sp. TaxID=455651 RepID=UPI002617209E|nr:NepR family anti-sigma factor [uncultured Tateyamaria sp.]